MSWPALHTDIIVVVLRTDRCAGTACGAEQTHGMRTRIAGVQGIHMCRTTFVDAEVPCACGHCCYAGEARVVAFLQRRGVEGAFRRLTGSRPQGEQIEARLQNLL
jgi:hypothetical protein